MCWWCSGSIWRRCARWPRSGGASFVIAGRKITVTLGAHSFACVAGQHAGMAGWQKISLPLAPFLLNDCCYAPLQECVAALGGAVQADADVRQAQITLPGVTPFTVSLRFIPGPVSQLGGSNDELFLVKTDGSRVQQLTYAYADAYGAHAALDKTLPAGPPSFTPDGASLLYVHGQDIVLRRLDSPGETVLTAAFSAKGIENAMPRANADGTCILRNGSTGMSRRYAPFAWTAVAIAVSPWVLFRSSALTACLIAYTARDANNEPDVHLLNVDGSKDRAPCPRRRLCHEPGRRDALL